MSAGTVISGGFPGRVAQEVQPNPKCNGCLHFDGQGGRIGICTIGERPWNCGEGDAADIGYAPIARGAGSYLHGMANHGAQAHEVGDQDASSLTGAGSTRAVEFTQVSLGEEHIHFVKSYLETHTKLQKSMCRLCQSSGMIGTAPANVGYQICTCAPVSAMEIAKALAGKLNNRMRSVIDLDDLQAFVYDVAKSKTASLEKATFFHTHGKYEVTPAGGGKHHVDFHPRGGGQAARVGKFDSPKAARSATHEHARKFAQGSTPMQKESAAAEIAPGWHAMAGKHHAKTPAGDHPKTAHEAPAGKKKITFGAAHQGKTGAHPISIDKGECCDECDDDLDKAGKTPEEQMGRPLPTPPKGMKRPKSKQRQSVAKKSEDGDDDDEGEGSIEKSIDDSKHSHVVTGPQAPRGKGFSSRTRAQTARDKMDSAHGAAHHQVSRNPHFKPENLKFENHGGYGLGAKVAEAGHGRYISQPEKNGGHNLTYAPHGQGEEGHLHGGWHGTPEKAHASAQEHHAAMKMKKSLVDTLNELHEEEDIEKSLRWSRKVDGEASTSHGSYSVHHDVDTGHHVVTYKPKGSDKGQQKKFGSKREALGAVVEHHLKNRPPPKPRAKKDPNAPKKPKGAGAGGCPPCP